jgi:hypothetical protein
MANALYLRRGGHLTGQHLRRIPGEHPEHNEEQKRDPDQDRDDGKQAFDYIIRHEISNIR